MITVLMSLILLIVFIFLSSIHFYWLFGGKWGLEQVIPTKENQIESHPIPQFATLLVALILLSFGIVYLLKSGLISIEVPNWITQYVYWIIPSIFIIRAIGDFKYLGIFKRVKKTKFAKADTKLFIPLCLIIGVTGFIVHLL